MVSASLHLLMCALSETVVAGFSLYAMITIYQFLTFLTGSWL